MPTPLAAPALGGLLAGTTLLVAIAEWTGVGLFYHAANLAFLPLVAILTWFAPWSRRIFVLVAAALAIGAMATREDWLAIIEKALTTGAFIAAFFTALSTLRNASSSSETIRVCGSFLAQQPPGRRYAALTVGGHLFALLLNYGSLVLLGGMAEAQARLEPDEEIRRHRTRRMLLAIQRGMVSTLAWSPLAFAMAISISVIPGATWAEAVGPCLVSAALIAGLGWALDAIFKPRLSHPAPPRAKPDGDWLSLWPLLALLIVLLVGVGGLHYVSGVRSVAVVMLFTPTLSALWIAAQAAPGRRLATLGQRARAYVSEDLPGYRNEVLLLMMAGFIGALGSRLLGPLVAASGLDVAALGGWPLLVLIVWLIPLTGQLGMNPILSVSLFAPILPEAAALGLDPTDLIVAITAGWALSGASSPYTATTLLIGHLGQVSAFEVGLRWNGLYTIVCAVALSIWVTIEAAY